MRRAPCSALAAELFATGSTMTLRANLALAEFRNLASTDYQLPNILLPRMMTQTTKVEISSHTGEWKVSAVRQALRAGLQEFATRELLTLNCQLLTINLQLTAPVSG